MTRDDEFTQGFVCAVAQLVHEHDCPSMAKDLLKSVQPINWAIIDRYDKAILRKAGLVPKLTRVKAALDGGKGVQG